MNVPESELYISDMVTADNFKLHHLNLIVSSCGAGKSYFVINKLTEMYAGLKPSEILVVTSRALTAQQQASQQGTVRVYGKEPSCWTVSEECDFEFGQNRVPYIYGSRIGITTYSSLHSLLNQARAYIQSKKIIVLDEFHSVFVDTFTGCKEWCPLWIYEKILSDTMMIAISATPEPIYDGLAANMPIHAVLGEDHEIRKYAARNIICTYYEQLPSILREQGGKTLILCNDAWHCEQLHAILPYSVILYGRNHPKHTDNMGQILDYIAEYEAIPEGYWIPSGSSLVGGGDLRKLVPFNTVISTTVMREGFSLREYSGVCNVVCCTLDPVDIVQFVGRCRYDVENLIIAPMRSSYVSHEMSYHQLYADFLATKSADNSWAINVIGRVYDRDWTDIAVVNPSQYKALPNIRQSGLGSHLSAFEIFMFDHYVTDLNDNKEELRYVTASDYKMIKEMARKTLYFQQTPSKMSVKKALDHFCDRFNIEEKIISVFRASCIRLYIVKNKQKAIKKATSTLVEEVDALLFARYSNPRGVASQELKYIPEDEILDIKAIALQGMVFGDATGQYSVKRICKRFCELYGHKMLEITREHGDVTKKHIALVVDTK